MTEWFYPTAFQSWGEEEQAAIDRVLRSGRFTMGDEVRAFEEEFAAFHGMKHAVMANSGSSANLLMIAALFNKAENPLRRGDVAVVPALAWSTTYAPLVQHGLDLILADCDESWNADFISAGLRAAVNHALVDHAPERHRPVRLVIACSILGNPAALANHKRNADHDGAYFLEDNCESLGAGLHDGKGEVSTRTGTFGLMNAFSLFWSHQLSAIEGGVVTTNDDDLVTMLRMLRAHGWTRDVEHMPHFEDEYRFEVMGYNVRPLELHAAIARAQLPKLEGFRKQREQNLNNFVTWATGLPIAVQRRTGIPSPFGIAFRVKDKATRSRLVTALRAASIDCRLPTGGSFSRHPYGAPWRDQKTPNADLIHDTGLFLGNAPFDISERILRAVKIMREVL